MVTVYGLAIKNLPAMQETQDTHVWSPGGEDPLEKGMATHSRTLAGESQGQKSLAGYSPWGCQESDTTEHMAHPTEAVISLWCDEASNPLSAISF